MADLASCAPCRGTCALAQWGVFVRPSRLVDPLLFSLLRGPKSLAPRHCCRGLGPAGRLYHRVFFGADLGACARVGLVGRASAQRGCDGCAFGVGTGLASRSRQRSAGFTGFGRGLEPTQPSPREPVLFPNFAGLGAGPLYSF